MWSAWRHRCILSLDRDNSAISSADDFPLALHLFEQHWNRFEHSLDSRIFLKFLHVFAIRDSVASLEIVWWKQLHLFNNLLRNRPLAIHLSGVLSFLAFKPNIADGENFQNNALKLGFQELFALTTGTKWYTLMNSSGKFSKAPAMQKFIRKYSILKFKRSTAWLRTFRGL